MTLLQWLLLAPVVVGFFMCCCGEDECIFAEDDFNRADNGNITTGSSCGWTESAGAWSISSNTLIVASANALAVCGTTPTSLYSYGQADVKSSASGDKIQLRFAITGGSLASGSALIAELTLGSPGKLKIIVGGTDYRTCDVTAAVNTFYTLKCCIANFSGEPGSVYDRPTQTQLGVTISLDGVMLLSAMIPDSFAGSPGVGLATGGTVTGTVVFDNAVFGNTYTDDASCPNCAGECCWPPGDTLPAQLKLTLSGIATDPALVGIGGCNTGDCENWNGDYYLDLTDDADCYAYTGLDEMCACYSLDVSLPCSNGAFGPRTKIWCWIGSHDLSQPNCGLYLEIWGATGSRKATLYHTWGLDGPTVFAVNDIDGGTPTEVAVLNYPFSGGSSIQNDCDVTSGPMVATIEAV